jgi:hypothetical protein
MSLYSIGSPFTIGDIAVAVDIEPEFLEALRRSTVSSILCTPLQETFTYPAKLLQSSFRFIYLVDPFLSVAESAPQRILVRFKPRIELEDT